MRRPIVLATLAGLVASAAVVLPAPAATPAGGTLDADHPQVAWSGSTMAQTAGFGEVGCVTALGTDPTCDFFELTIGATTAPADDVEITLGTDDPFVAEFDLYVYDDAGNEVGRSVEFGSDETLTLVDPPSATYTVAVQNVLSTNVANSYRASAVLIDAGDGPALDIETPCGMEGLDDTPLGRPDDPIGAGAVTGDPTVVADSVHTSEFIRLTLGLVLDGVDLADALEIVDGAERSYRDLGIWLEVTGLAIVDVTDDPAFDTDDGMAKIRAAKAHFGGERPEGVDVVAVLTDDDIQQLGQKAVAGIADCIGGIAHDDRAFFVAEAASDYSDIPIGPFVFAADATSTVFAHELGHLMGGQHHYANCVQGVSSDDIDGPDHIEGSPCTLMFNAADFLGHGFGTLNGRIVRGSAVRHLAD